jgi:DNA invertase Pin-like site-specific DNA recombinase
MQLLEIRNYLKDKGITDYKIYEDKGISGTKRDRPSLNRLMADCRASKVSMVICYRMDRLARSLVDLMNMLTEFQKTGIEFVALKDGVDMTTAAGRLMVGILASFAEFEAAVIKERIMSGLKNAKSKGVRLGRPYKKGHAVVNQMKADGKTVKEIALHTGLSIQSVYNTLNRDKAVV